MCCVCEILLSLIYVHVCDECVLNARVYSVEKTSEEQPPQSGPKDIILIRLLKQQDHFTCNHNQFY